MAEASVEARAAADLEAAEASEEAHAAVDLEVITDLTDPEDLVGILAREDGIGAVTMAVAVLADFLVC